MRESFLLLLQLILLIRLKVGFVQLFQLKTDIVFLLLALSRLVPHIFQFPSQRLITGKFLLIKNEQDLIFGHYIDHFQLETVVAQQ